MRSEIVAAGADPETTVAALRELIPAAESVAAGVAEIIAEVRARGDDAVLQYTQRFDTGGTVPRPLRVPRDAVRAAAEQLPQAVAEALGLAIANVGDAARAAVQLDRTVRVRGAEVTLREAPVWSAAVYVPGGRAPYPSTVVMGVVTAIAAGVPEVVVCAPPGRDGEIDPVVLGACELAAATGVYRMGGAQAIAALAYGTATVKPVDVIVGPGNLWVQEAKRQVSGQVGIDSFAGPSDLLVLAEPGSDPEPIALDLLAQAEHGDGTLVLAASTSRELLEQLAALIERAADTGAVCRLIELHDLNQAWSLAQAFAPEHLELIGPEVELLAGTAFGDYIAGSNHILPTGGTGRFASALSVRAFRRSFTEVRVGDPSLLASTAAPLARAEGFEYHARSMEARIRDNQPG